MTCDPIRFQVGTDPDGKPIYVSGIVCSRGRRPWRKKACEFCGAPGAGFLCDFELGKKKTCDKQICGGCRVSVGRDRDFCPEHQHGRPQLDLFDRQDRGEP